MTLQEIDALCEKIEALGLGDAYLARIVGDLRNVYRAQHGSLPASCRKAWDSSILSRLEWVQGRTGSSGLQQVSNWLKSRVSIVSLTPILFGQMRIASTFAGQTVNTPHGIADRRLVDVANAMRAGTLDSDLLPVQIAPRQGGAGWVAINNRGYATYSLAGIVPLRLFPRKMTVDESNRLRQAAPDFTFEDGVRLTQDPRRLPSVEMPITAGVNDLRVEQVVQAVVQ